MRSVLAFLLVAVYGADALLKNVTISKCCPFDSYLSKETNYTCTTKPSNLTWTLNIYQKEGNKTSISKSTEPPKNWRLKENSRPGCKNPTPFSAKSPTSYVVFLNGKVFMPAYTSNLFHPSNYCIDYNVVMVCTDEEEEAQQLIKPKARVKKCCGEGAVYTDFRKSCRSLNSSYYKVDVGDDVALVAGFPECDEHLAIAGKLNDTVLMANGSLLLPETGILLDAGSFCLENVLESADSPSVFTCHNYILPSVSEEQLPKPDLRFTLYPIGLALSAVFLAATLAAGFLLPASHHVLHWRCQTNHVACLLIGDVLLCITQLSGNSMGTAACTTIAVVMHFWFLAAFFWLNTMCFNIWWTFRDLRPQSLEKGQERCRLRLYEVYAWGGPLIIAGTAAILDSIPHESGAKFLRPKFCEKNAWFGGEVEALAYFFGPVGALLLVNLALFAATARELTCGLWKRELVKSTTERAALGRVCMKLVVVMGITWIIDVISWVVGGPQELWYIPDLINSLQGVFIFIVIGCQPQVLAAAKRLWCWRKHRATGNQGTANHHSSSSQGLPSVGDTVTNHSVTTNTTRSVPLETTC